ncbi:MAG: hypothetical protein QF578_07305 [Alphaproteobacteria bacterium]|nr:hypothetical protein [Alphaproteobacteria bacterium]
MPSITKSRSGNVEYTSAFDWVWSEIYISNQPSDAVINYVKVEWDVDSNYISDIDWYVENYSDGYSSNTYTMPETGNDLLDGYSETSDSYKIIYPSNNVSVNGYWYFNVRDVYNDTANGTPDWDKGRIDYWKLTINYEVVDTTPPGQVTDLAISGGSSWNDNNPPTFSWDDASDNEGIAGPLPAGH